MRTHHNDTGRLVGGVYLAEVFAEGGQEYLMVVSVSLLCGYGLDVRRSAGGPGHCDIIGSRGLRWSARRQLFRQVCWVEGYACKERLESGFWKLVRRRIRSSAAVGRKS